MERGRSITSDRIDELGGHGRGDRGRLPAARDHGRRLPYQRAIDSAEKIVVGVNAFRMETEDRYDPLYIDESVTADQIANLNRVKAERDGRAVEQSLQALRNAASDPNANTMPFIIDAVKAYATVGEVSDALRAVFGTYQEPAAF